MEKDEFALTAALLEGVRVDELPDKYADLKDIYQQACYSEAERLYAGGKPYEAMRYYQAVPGYRDADSRLEEGCYKILGAWQTGDGKMFVFRPDGTCTMDGEVTVYALAEYMDLKPRTVKTRLKDDGRFWIDGEKVGRKEPGSNG